MIPTVIERDILVEAPVDVVWRVVTEPAQITRWFSDTADVDVRPGGDGTLVFDQQATSQRFTVPIVVESDEPPHRVTVRCSHPDDERPRPGNSNLVQFTLTAECGG